MIYKPVIGERPYGRDLTLWESAMKAGVPSEMYIQPILQCVFVYGTSTEMSDGFASVLVDCCYLAF